MRPTVAVLGCGRWGVNIVRDLVSLDCAVAVADPTPEGRSRGLAAGAIDVVDDLPAAAAATGRLDGVVIATPTRDHVRLAREAAALGVPVFVEKPLADDVAMARDLVRDHGDVVFVMHKWHYHPGVQALAAHVADGSVGTLLEVHTERLGSAQPSDLDDLWLLAPHEVSIARAIIGSWPTTTTAAVLRHGRQIDATAESRWLHGPVHHWHLRTTPGPTTRSISVIGTKGRAVLDGAYADHIVVDGRLVPVSVEFPLLRELRVFRDHLSGGPPPPTTAADGLAAMEIIATLATNFVS